MDLVKFLKSFCNIDTYLCLATALLIFLSIYFYILVPYD